MKRSRVRPRLAAVLIALCSCVGLVSLSVAPAWAAGTVTTFPVPSTPFFITSGPDGSLWFTLGETGQIGRITTSGTITEFSVSTGHGSKTQNSGPLGITAGPDGNLWFTDKN
jgi:streptogramin lyase